jgi:hypothetical protein
MFMIDATERQACAVSRIRDLTKQAVYIAGPMTGYQNHNFEAFNQAAEDLRRKGLEVVNPADHGVVEGASWEDYLRYDIQKLSECGAVYFLCGWEKSAGASLEWTIARQLGLSVEFQEGAAHWPNEDLVNFRLYGA